MDEQQGEKSPQEPSNSELKQIRTFQGDVADALGRQKESLVSIQQREAEKKRALGEIAGASAATDESKRRDILYLSLGSVFLIAVGLFGAWYGYKEFVRRSAPPVAVAPASRLITPNLERSLNVASSTREKFAADFAKETGGLKADELKHVVLRVGQGESAPIMETGKFFNLLESRAPGSLIRSFEKLFMVGGLGEEQFLIIKTSSFENAYPGMLSWEADMAEELIPVFANANTLPEKANEGGYVFKDTIIRNKDVRVLNAGFGTSTRPVLLYTFFDNSMVVITESPETLQILMDRLSREKLSR